MLGLECEHPGDVHKIIWPAGTSLDGKKLLLPEIREALTVGAATTGRGGGPGSRSYPPCISKGEEVSYIDGISLTY